MLLCARKRAWCECTLCWFLTVLWDSGDATSRSLYRWRGDPLLRIYIDILSVFTSACSNYDDQYALSI